MRIFCKHDYEIIKEHEIKSQFEKLIGTGVVFENIEGEDIVEKMGTCVYVIVLKCAKCNKIKYIKTTN